MNLSFCATGAMVPFLLEDLKYHTLSQMMNSRVYRKVSYVHTKENEQPNERA